MFKGTLSVCLKVYCHYISTVLFQNHLRRMESLRVPHTETKPNRLISSMATFSYFIAQHIEGSSRTLKRRQ
jgi:hypothetical protein